MKNISNLIDSHKQSLEIFCNELLLWSKTHNITGYKTTNDIMQNIADSLRPLEFISDFERALDIGSGCGFPAIPLAICNSDKNFVLVEPNAKKASFLKVISVHLGLDNVVVLKERLQRVKLTLNADLITSRAVDKAENIITMSAHLLTNNGYFLFYKSASEFADEAQQIESQNDNLSKIFYFYKSKSESLTYAKSKNKVR